MKIFVCKPYNMFVEPCCSQVHHGLENKSALFSADIVTTFCYLEKMMGNCFFKELDYPLSKQKIDDFAENDVLLLFISFPNNIGELFDLIGFSEKVRKKGTRIVLVTRNSGYIDMLMKKYAPADVAVQARDTLAAMEVLLVAEWFKGKSWSGSPVIHDKDINAWPEYHGQFSFLMAPKIVREKKVSYYGILS